MRVHKALFYHIQFWFSEGYCSTYHIHLSCFDHWLLTSIICKEIFSTKIIILLQTGELVWYRGRLYNIWLCKNKIANKITIQIFAVYLDARLDTIARTRVFKFQFLIFYSRERAWWGTSPASKWLFSGVNVYTCSQCR